MDRKGLTQKRQAFYIHHRVEYKIQTHSWKIRMTSKFSPQHDLSPEWVKNIPSQEGIMGEQRFKIYRGSGQWEVHRVTDTPR